MNFSFSRILSLSLLLTPFISQAVPAKRDLRTVTQPDGSTLQVRRVGDESLHFIVTADGVPLCKNTLTGAYEYARLTACGALESTGVIARDKATRPAADVAVASPLSPQLVRSRRVAARPMRIAQEGMGRFTSTFPRKGDVNVLVILVNYSDVKFTLSDPQAYFEAMLNEEGFSQYGGTGSCKDYFRDNSGGQFTPHFKLYGPVDLPHNRAYYGGNDVYDQDQAAEQMVVDACETLDQQIDFSEFDNDGDGVVDNVYIFYAGQGEASYGPETSVWPHSWELTSAKINLILDGVRIDRYACSNEWEQARPDGIGTFVHEFSHVMGLPDLYTTDYSDAGDLTPGSYSVMDYGPYNNDGRTPPAYSIYERNAMTWLVPRVIDSPVSVTLEQIQDSNDGCIVCTDSDTEFFLFENRQQTGWDSYIPGHGMLIWHVDFDQAVFDDNEVNNAVSHQYVDIVEACGVANNTSMSRMEGYPWPGAEGKTEFSATTRPAFKSWSGRSIDLPITDIAEDNGVISFNVAGGTPLPPPVDTPVAETPIDSGSGYFVAWWEPVTAAIDYSVDLYMQGEGDPMEYVADMGSGSSPVLPQGWSASTIAGYTSYGNYGLAKPSFKLATDGAWILTSEFDDDISSVSFWCRGQQADGSSLELFGLTDSTWQSLGTVAPVKTEVLTPSFTGIPAGTRQLKLVWHKSRGNISIDDIVVRTVPSDLLLRSIESTGGETSVRFDALETGDYYYTVSATDGEYTTRHSAPAYVSVSVSGVALPDSGISAPAQYYDMLGRRIIAPAPGTLVIERRGSLVIKRVMR